MAATISINFATPEEVFSSTPPFKKSISAKTLADVLGGGQVGGGYVQRTGAKMTGFLTLLSSAPFDPYHAVHKNYVDQHAFTRRYQYTVGQSLSAGTTIVYGRDDNDAKLYFFDQTDTYSINTIYRYVDVFRNGILQVFGQDYNFLNVEVPEELITIIPPKVQFYSPLLSGTNVAIHIGNKGATPTVLGVASLSALNGSGIRLGTFLPGIATGDLTISAYPLDFAATVAEMKQPRRVDKLVSPVTLSAFPLMPKAFGIFRKEPGYTRVSSNDPYGNTQGYFTTVKGFNINSLRTKVGVDSATTFTCTLSPGVFASNESYTPRIEVSVESSASLFDYAVPVVFNSSKTTTLFKFELLTLYFSSPDQVDEVSIVVY
jgi:hypothetical protein